HHGGVAVGDRGEALGGVAARFTDHQHQRVAGEVVDAEWPWAFEPEDPGHGVGQIGERFGRLGGPDDEPGHAAPVPWRMVTAQAPLSKPEAPPPVTWARPRRAPTRWRSPAVPRSWLTSSTNWAAPVAPIGWPRLSRPPLGFTTAPPSGASDAAAPERT